MTFFRHKDGWCRRGVVEGRRPRRPNNRAIPWQQSYAYNDPLLFVIPSEAEESAVRLSGAPDLPVYNYLPFVILKRSEGSAVSLYHKRMRQAFLRSKANCSAVAWTAAIISCS